MYTDSAESNERMKKKISRACDGCAKRKIKCDAAKPRCNWCEHLGIPCTFDRALPRRQGKAAMTKQQRQAQLEERLARIETILTRGSFSNDSAGNSQSDSQPSIKTDVSPDSPHSEMKYFTDSMTPSISPPATSNFVFNDLQEWVRSLIGHSINLKDLCTPACPWQYSGPDRPYLERSPQSLSLPDINIIKQCVELYNKSHLRHVFPVIDSSFFKDTINLAYQSSPTPHYGTASARACIWTFLALHTAWNIQTAPPLSVDNQVLIAEAERYMPEILHEASMDGLQVFVMLMVFHTITGNLQSAAFMGSLAARLIYTLGAHVKSPLLAVKRMPAITQDRLQKDDHLRNLFWIAYILDIELSIRTGRPPSLHDGYCDLTLPLGYKEQLDKLVSADPFDQVPFSVYVYPCDLRLGQIKSRAYITLYAPGALRQSDTDLLRAIRELDTDLENWRLSIPSNIRPTPSIRRETPTGNYFLDMHSLVLQMDYYHCLVIIHQASSRCKAWSNSPSNVAQGVTSSFALAVETSRSSLLSLKHCLRILLPGTFWFFIFHPTAAVLAIFCNIILNPLDPRVSEDLDLLNQASELIRELPSCDALIPDILHVARLETLIAEMGEIAKRAIDDARNSQD